MTDVLVYATESRAATVRTLLGAACQATGIGARLELYRSGSLYQRLGPRRAPPFPDLVFWYAPFAAQAASIDGLLQAHQPAHLADGMVHTADWSWTTLDYSVIGVVGSPAANGLADVAGVHRLAAADPERSEVGLSILLATLDHARQVESDTERGWTWWQQRAQKGLVMAEDDAAAVALVPSSASHAVSMRDMAAPLMGLAPIPNAISLTASSRNVAAARRLLDWLTSEPAGASLRWSPWQAASNGLAGLLAAAPPLDIEWTRQQYTAARRRWAHSGFGPVPTA